MRFTSEEDRVVIDLRGLASAEEIGRRIGKSADAVRRRWRNLGLTPTKPKTVAQKRAEACAGKTDAELIALHLARKGVTRCPPAPACGITTLEQHTGFTAQPQPSLTYREKMDRMAKAAIARRVA